MLTLEATGKVQIYLLNGEGRSATATGHPELDRFVYLVLKDGDGSEVRAQIALDFARDLHDDLTTAIAEAAGETP